MYRFDNALTDLKLVTQVCEDNGQNRDMSRVEKYFARQVSDHLKVYGPCCQACVRTDVMLLNPLERGGPMKSKPVFSNGFVSITLSFGSETISERKYKDEG